MSIHTPIRVIVGGSNLRTHYGELRAVTVNVADPDQARPLAEHEVHHVNNFYSHQVYITENDGNPAFEALWNALTRKPENEVITIVIDEGIVQHIENLPPGWSLCTIDVTPSDAAPDDDDDPNDDDPKRAAILLNAGYP